LASAVEKGADRAGSESCDSIIPKNVNCAVAPLSALILEVVGATAAEFYEISFVLRSIEIEVEIGKMI
jgi:hypothetical protein